MFGAVGEIVSRMIASVLAIGVLAVVMLSESPRLGLLLLVMAPLMVMVSWPLLKPLSEARVVQRSRQSTLTGMATDIVAGLRILRGIGGERTFGDNYARQSQAVRRASDAAAPWQAAVMALAVLTSGVMMVMITWLGTKEVMAGSLHPGELVSFFGFAVFLVMPIQTIFMFINRWTQAKVSATKAITLLRQTPPWTEPENPVALPREGALVDEQTGFRAESGMLTVIVSAIPDDSARLAERLGRYLPDEEDTIKLSADSSLKGRAARRERERLDKLRAERDERDRELVAGDWGVTLGGVDLAHASLMEVRQRIVVSDPSAAVFAGTLQDMVDPHARGDREAAEQAMLAASAEDVYEAVPGGWAGTIDEKGRGLSGGQRQRLVLARALLMNPDVLILVEPTSAVDAHTEARIADRVPQLRRGRSTIITTVSPLWLRHADQVVLMVEGQCVARGTHEQLQELAEYRAVVSRGMEDSDE